MSEKPRIALVHSFYSSQQPSGENLAVRAHEEALRRAGYVVEVFGAHTDQLQSERLYQVRAAGRVATGAGRSPRRALEHFGAQIVYVHNLFPNWGRRWVSELGVPLVAVLHNYRPLCANGLLYRGGDSVCTLCPDGRRWSGVQHACYRDSRLATLPLAWANRRGPAEDPLLRSAARIVVLSSLQRSVYVRAGVPESKLRVWPSFLPRGLDVGAQEANGSPHRAGWLFVGRLGREKGIAELVRRWPAGHTLRIVGAGPDEELVRSAAAGRDIELLGKRSRSEVLALMGASLGLVFASPWYEGFPLVYVEAMAQKTPVLAVGPNVVGQLVEEDGTGQRVSWDELPTALARAETEAPWRGLRGRCRDVFEARYTEGAYLGNVLRLHRELLPTTTGQ